MTELVVLCDPAGHAVGTADKATVHHRDTPLHLAFSCYVFDRAGRLLVTRRARTKATWPGVRTSSCCGHPVPGESMTAAVRRRLHDELGLEAAGVDLLLPGFRYRSVMADGTVENELCPVWRTIVGDPHLSPDPEEVDEAWWVAWPEFLAGLGARDTLAPWAVLQAVQLQALGADPLRWPVGDAAGLPAAATA